MKKSLLLLVLICSVLVLMPSCRKKGDESDNVSVAETLVSKENSTVRPLVVVPAPDVESAKAETPSPVVVDTVKETVTDKEEEVIETPSDPEPVEEVVATSEPVITEEVRKEEVLTEEEKKEEETDILMTPIKDEEKEDVIYFDFTYSYGDYMSHIVIASSYTTLTIPDGVSDADIAAVAQMISSSYPYEASLITYSLADGKVTLFYPAQSADYIYSVLPVVEKEAQNLLDMYPKKTEVPVPVAEETEEEKVEVVVPEAVKAPGTADNNEKKESDKRIPDFSISAYSRGMFNIAGNSESVFEQSFGVRAELGLGRFSFLLDAQYELQSYIAAKTGVRYEFLSMHGFDFYALLSGGAGFGVGSKYRTVMPTAGAALGATYRFTDNLAVFAEAGIEWRGNSRFALPLLLGLKVTF